MQPTFSICVPQFNRTSFFLEACRRLTRQTFDDFEVCVSDDCSTDGRSDELVEFLRSSGLRHVYYRQQTNVRYDANLRTAISLASGHYCLLMGNDDCFAKNDTLETLNRELLSHPEVGVVMTNYAEYGTGRVYRRVPNSRLVGAGPEVAASRYRNFSFVSGILLRTDRAKAHATAKWDGSEMYQMYIGCRIIAEGLDLLELKDVAVLMGISVDGESVDSYASRPPIRPCPITERRLPLTQLPGLVHDAVAPYAAARPARLALKVFAPFLMLTYPYWLVEYRRVQSWPFATGVALGMRPRNLFERTTIPPFCRWLLALVYLAVTAAGLSFPIGVFDRLRPWFYRVAKSVR